MPEQEEDEEELRPVGEENRSESDVEFHAVRSYFGLDVNPLGADDDSCLASYLYDAEDAALEDS